MKIGDNVKVVKNIINYNKRAFIGETGVILNIEEGTEYTWFEIKLSQRSSPLFFMEEELEVIK